MDLFNKGALEKVASIEQDIATGRDERAKKIENISKKVLSVINDDFVSTTNKMRMLLLWLASSVTETDAKLDKLIKDIVLDDMDTLERALKNLSQLKKTTSRKVSATFLRYLILSKQMAVLYFYRIHYRV
jgi:hypothetical protein